MANLAGKLMFGVALEPQCRLVFIPWARRNSLMNCLKGRDYGTAFPVRYVPKNPSKPQKLRTSSPPPSNDLEFKDERNGLDQSSEKVEFSDGVIKVLERAYIRKKSGTDSETQNLSQVIYDFEDENKFIDSLECGKVVGKDYIPNKFGKVEECQTSSPRMGESEDKDKYNSGYDVERVESSNGRNNFEDKDDEDDLEPDLAMVESLSGGKVLRRRYIPKKSVDTGNAQTFFRSINFADKVEYNSSESNKEKERYLDGGKNLERSYASDKKLNQNTTPINNFICNNGPEDEEIDRTWESNDDEDVEEYTDDLQEKDPMQNHAYQSVKTRLDVEKKAITLLATRYPKLLDGCGVIRDMNHFDGIKRTIRPWITSIWFARAFTTVELRKKLLAKQFPLQMVNEVVADFQNRGLLNDFLYAESFSRSRFSSSSWGPRRIQQALLRKGVSEEDAKKALKVVFKDDVSSEDQELRQGLSKLSLDHLYVQASKQWLRNQVIPSDKRKSRLVQWLQYRGFNWGVIKLVLKKLESEYPP